MEIYVVNPGDTVDSVARRYDVQTESILYANQIPYPYALAIGQALLIPLEQEREKRTILSNGYAYPFISPWVLQQTLPYLTTLAVFSYGFTAEGQLLPPQLEDQWMLDLAVQYQTAPILTLTPFGTDGRFNNNLIHAVVNSPEAKERLFNELLQTMAQKGFQGTNVDFEYILAEDRDLFTQFVGEMTEQLNAQGYTVSVALAPKSSAGQQGLLYEGKDYGGLGAAANSVLLMTYEWGYTYGPPMAVAPLNKVRQVVEYALTEIPAAKIDLGIPNYGYDWPLPYEQGVTAARTIGNVEAVQIAIANFAEIQFDPVAQSPYFYYETEGVMHVVWFEDVRSMQASFDLIEEFGLRGAGYWQIMRLFRANWLLLAENFWISKL